MVALRIENLNDRRGFEYASWVPDLEKAPSVGKLTDDTGAEYKRVTLGFGNNVKDRSAYAAVGPGGAINDVLVFEVPAATAKHLDLDSRGELQSERDVSVPHRDGGDREALQCSEPHCARNPRLVAAAPGVKTGCRGNGGHEERDSLHLGRDGDTKRGRRGLVLLRTVVDGHDLLVRVWVVPRHQVDADLGPDAFGERVLPGPRDLRLRRLLLVRG